MIPNPHGKRVAIYNSIIFLYEYLHVLKIIKTKLLTRSERLFIFFLFFRRDRASGVSRISFRGGGGVGGSKNFLQTHAFARGVRRHAPQRKFLKMVQFGVF